MRMTSNRHRERDVSDYQTRCKKALELYRSGVPSVLIAERFGIQRPSVNRMLADAQALEKSIPKPLMNFTPEQKLVPVARLCPDGQSVRRWLA